MALSLLQRGTGPARPLVAAFGPMTVAKLPKTLGPVPCIVADPDPKGEGAETIAQIVDFAAKQAGVGHFGATALIGFSIGCKRVRQLRIGGATAGAYLLVDGTHANWPPLPWQIEWLQALAADARAGRILLVASHTYQTYVEKMAHPFAASVTVLRQATGFPLTAGGPPDAPVVSRNPLNGPMSSGLWVYSYASKEADYEAHKHQGGPVAHQLAARHLAPWIASLSFSAPASPLAPPWPAIPSQSTTPAAPASEATSSSGNGLGALAVLGAAAALTLSS
jgi:hypothetical protein